MLNIFRSKSNQNSNDVKSFLIDELFNSKNQKKVVIKAARESAAVQRKVVEEYRKLSKNRCVAKSN